MAAFDSSVWPLFYNISMSDDDCSSQTSLESDATTQSPHDMLSNLNHDEVEIEKQCKGCGKIHKFNTCADRTHVCRQCDFEMKGVNAFRDYPQRVTYYQDALDQCKPVNPLILPFICSMVTSYCAEPPRFEVEQNVDFYYVQRQYFIKTKVR